MAPPSITTVGGAVHLVHLTVEVVGEQVWYADYRLRVCTVTIYYGLSQPVP